MVLSALLGLFFAAFAAGSLSTARQEYRWRNAVRVHGVLVKQGSVYHYEYRPKNEAAVVGPRLPDQFSDKPDGVVDDWVRLDYDPNLPERFRQLHGKGKPATNYAHFLITASVGTAFSVLVLACAASFIRAARAAD